jgi:hypothetical protein
MGATRVGSNVIRNYRLEWTAIPKFITNVKGFVILATRLVLTELLKDFLSSIKYMPTEH